MEEAIKIDFRVGYIQTRNIRDGNRMLLQGRTNFTHPDGHIDYGEWMTTTIITNYGDCFDKKTSLLDRVKSFFHKDQ